MTTKEAAERLGCTPALVRLMIRNGKLQADYSVDERNGSSCYDVDARSVEEELANYNTLSHGVGRRRGSKNRVKQT